MSDPIYRDPIYRTAAKEMRLAESYSQVAEKAATGQWGAGLNPVNEYVNNWRRGVDDADAFLRTASPEAKLQDAQQFVSILADRMAQAGMAGFRDRSDRNANLLNEAGTAAGQPPATAQELINGDAQNRAGVREQHAQDKKAVPGNPGRPADVPPAATVKGVVQTGIGGVMKDVDKGQQAVDEDGKPVADSVAANIENGQQPLGAGARAVAGVDPTSDFNSFKNNPANPGKPKKGNADDGKPGGGASGSW